MGMKVKLRRQYLYANIFNVINLLQLNFIAQLAKLQTLNSALGLDELDCLLRQS